MTKRGLLMILSGASGAGKGTVLKEYLARHDDTVVSVSVTTRSPRVGEQDGVHYFFRTKEEAERMIAENRFLEHACYNGQYYGTPKEPVEQWLSEGKNVVLEIEVQGAMQVMARCEDYVSVFLTTPSMEELERRLRGRGTEEEAFIQARLEAAQREMQYVDRYQYVVLNDTVENAVSHLESIVETEKSRRHPQ